MKKPLQIFCCYAREDQSLLHELLAHLMPLQRQGLVTIWSDQEINAGTAWEQAITDHLSMAQIILLLVSSSFMASEYCYGKEMKQALMRHQRGEALVIPVILRPVHWQDTPFSKLQALPDNAYPVTGKDWHTQDEAFLAVAQGVNKAVLQLLPEARASSQVSQRLEEAAPSPLQLAPKASNAPKTTISSLHPWSLVTITLTTSFLLCFSLLITIILHQSWCPALLCPAPQPLLHPGGNNDKKLEIYPIALQSDLYVVPSNPTRCRQSQHLDCIGAVETYKQDSSPYYLTLGLQNLQEGRFGITIEKVELVVQQVLPIPHPLNVLRDPSSTKYKSTNLYQAAYKGQGSNASLPVRYLSFKFVRLGPRGTDQDTDTISIQVISLEEADIQFSVQVTYRFNNESQRYSLRLPGYFEVVFADASHWHFYHRQGDQFVANP